MRIPPQSPIIVALDYAQARDALAFADSVPASACRLKIGKQLFTRCGPSLVKALQQRGFQIFLDLKFHDIPNTVAAAVSAAAELGVWMLNVHASGGERMMQAASAALAPFAGDAPLLIAVTVLTSMTQQDLDGIGIQVPLAEHAWRLAALTRQCGLAGVVCSPQEAAHFKQAFGADFCLVTPGIRPQGSKGDDQRRIMTPQQARQAGVDYMVIGRPVTRADNPAQALADIAASLQAVN